MINFPCRLAHAESWITRATYRAALPLIVRREIKPAREIDIDVFSYSGEAALPEQVASIRSFVKHVGRPRLFGVVSDGSYGENSVKLLERIDPVVSVQPFVKSEVAVPKFDSYLATHPTGKQLALIMAMPVCGPVLYFDSDVLFFPGASDLIRLISKRDAPAYYLADCQFSGDHRLLRDPNEENQPVNTGALLLFEKLDWSLSVRRFLELKGEPDFFTNQTMTHLTMHASGARPFDPAKYVLQRDDEFRYRDLHAGRSIALRHYVTPVRHKFWTPLARSNG